MRLHWFREHKQIVYWVLCPAVVLSMSIFGISSCGRNAGMAGSSSGPGVAYTVGNKEVSLAPNEVFQKRQILYKYVGGYVPKDNRREDNPTTDNIATLCAENDTARLQGFEIGDEELKEIKRNTVIGRIKQIDGVSDVKLTKDIYEKLLSQLDMTQTQFESIVYELALRNKFHENVYESIVVPDSELYVEYSKSKATVRIRYKLIKTDDLMKDTKAPTESAIKEFWDQNQAKKDNSELKDIYKSPALMSIEALHYKDDKIFADVKPTEDDLRKFYDIYKSSTDGWKDKNPTNPNDPFWPLATVHAEVEKRWKEDKLSALRNTVSGNVTKALKELNDAEEAFKKDEKNKDKEFDVKAFAAAHNMTFWVTPEQTRDTYSSGKLEVNAPDLNIGMTIFQYTDLTGNQPPDSLKNQMKHMYEFTAFRWIDNNKPELGGIVARAKKYTEEKVNALADAKDKVIERLKIIESKKLAKEAAEKLREQWRQGKDLPKLEELDEVTSDAKEHHPIVQVFRRAPKANGEVLDVAEGQPEGATRYDPDKTWFYVGCAVERKLPTVSGFANVTEADWSREDARKGQYYRQYRIKPGIIEEDYKSALAMMVYQIKNHINIIGNRESEPDVRRVFRDAPHEE